MASTLADSQSAIIEANSIGSALGNLRDAFHLACNAAGVPFAPGALEKLGEEDIRRLIFTFLATPRILQTASLLAPASGGPDLLRDLSNLRCGVSFHTFDTGLLKPLLMLATAEHVNDRAVWAQVYHAVAHTPPAPPRMSLFLPQPWLRQEGEFDTSAEYGEYMNETISTWVGPLFVGSSLVWETYFGQIPNLNQAANAAFQSCGKGNNPLYTSGRWAGRPNVRNQYAVLSWLTDLADRLIIFADAYKPMTQDYRRRPLARSRLATPSATAEHKLDIGIFEDETAAEGTQRSFSQILVPGVLKRNSTSDVVTEGWLDICYYAREVITAHDGRRFVLGFTLCEHVLRVWAFDRLGGVASGEIDINTDGVRFVATILGFLWMTVEQLGFDPTIKTAASGERFIEVERDGSVERLIIENVMYRTPALAGRAAKYWRVHREGQSGCPLAVKDSWEYPSLDEEGEILREVTAKGVINVARYYHHWTVEINGVVVDVRNALRRGLDVRGATNYPGNRAPQSADMLPNRVQRRVVIRDCGRPIYMASSRTAMLGGMKACIEGYKSLHEAGFLHRDISIHNLMINEDPSNPSWPAFLIDLDVSTSVEKLRTTGGERLDIGTREFIALGLLLGEAHSFMHDLESFFWVLFWICIRYVDSQGNEVAADYDQWYTMDLSALAEVKRQYISSSEAFLDFALEEFTDYYQPLVLWVDRLREVVFPSGNRWQKEDIGLFDRMTAVLSEAQEDPGLAGF